MLAKPDSLYKIENSWPSGPNISNLPVLGRISSICSPGTPGGLRHQRIMAVTGGVAVERIRVRFSRVGRIGRRRNPTFDPCSVRRFMSVESRRGAPAVGEGSSSCRQLSPLAGASVLPVAAFPLPAHRTEHAAFPHSALQWDHAFRTRNTLATAAAGGSGTPILIAKAARLPPSVPRRVRWVVEPVYASTTPSLPHGACTRRLARPFTFACDASGISEPLCGVVGCATPVSLLPSVIPPHLRSLPSTGITPLLRYSEPLRHPASPRPDPAGSPVPCVHTPDRVG